MLWVKAFHIIFMVTWMAGIFYLPRLFVYHAMNPENDRVGHARFVTMERKLLFGIMTPGAILTIFFGVWLIAGYGGLNYLREMKWLHAKLFLVFLLVVHHGFCWRYYAAFRDGKNVKTHRFFRIFNELPVFILIGTIILVEVKPF